MAAYISEIRVFAFGFAPEGWVQCNGQLLSISTNPVLFTLIGNAYGGNGKTTFAVPDLRGGVPMHRADGKNPGPGGGEATHALTVMEIPAHTHIAMASSNPADINSPSGSFWASKTGFNPYGSKPDTQMFGQALLNEGQSLPHENMAPYVVLNICMAVTGEFPGAL